MLLSLYSVIALVASGRWHPGDAVGAVVAALLVLFAGYIGALLRANHYRVPRFVPFLSIVLLALVTFVIVYVCAIRWS